MSIRVIVFGTLNAACARRSVTGLTQRGGCETEFTVFCSSGLPGRRQVTKSDGRNNCRASTTPAGRHERGPEPRRGKASDARCRIARERAAKLAFRHLRVRPMAELGL